MTEAAHEVEVWHLGEKTVQLKCSCGAGWTVSRVEFDQGVDHIEDHKHYALRTATRVD